MLPAGAMMPQAAETMFGQASKQEARDGPGPTEYKLGYFRVLVPEERGLASAPCLGREGEIGLVQLMNASDS